MRVWILGYLLGVGCWSSEVLTDHIPEWPSTRGSRSDDVDSVDKLLTVPLPSFDPNWHSQVPHIFVALLRDHLGVLGCPSNFLGEQLSRVTVLLSQGTKENVLQLAEEYATRFKWDVESTKYLVQLFPPEEFNSILRLLGPRLSGENTPDTIRDDVTCLQQRFMEPDLNIRTYFDTLSLEESNEMHLLERLDNLTDLYRNPEILNHLGLSGAPRDYACFPSLLRELSEDRYYSKLIRNLEPYALPLPFNPWGWTYDRKFIEAFPKAVNRKKICRESQEKTFKGLTANHTYALYHYGRNFPDPVVTPEGSKVPYQTRFYDMIRHWLSTSFLPKKYHEAVLAVQPYVRPNRIVDGQSRAVRA
uniref:Uncharacterized protein n=1 Tax=Timema bartmani TaxID=61472 RepID=A0A7R9F4N8_9NEOP|nr:unnamed protein product [Timema bartmani]